MKAIRELGTRNWPCKWTQLSSQGHYLTSFHNQNWFSEHWWNFLLKCWNSYYNGRITMKKPIPRLYHTTTLNDCLYVESQHSGHVLIRDGKWRFSFGLSAPFQHLDQLFMERYWKGAEGPKLNHQSLQENVSFMHTTRNPVWGPI